MWACLWGNRVAPTGLDIEGAVSIGKGHSNSDSQVQNHTEINADRLTMKANETTTLKGATANINHLALYLLFNLLNFPYQNSYNLYYVK